MNKNIMWIVVVVVIVAAALFFMYGLNPKTSLSPGIAPGGETQGPIVTSDNPDTMVDNILSSFQVGSTPLESDPSLTAPDSDITSGFDQAADTSGF